MAWYRWKPYVSVADRRRRASRKMEALRKKGVNVQPVNIEGRKIANTFWGEAWCDHLESFSDYENRLPRGRTYVRNGSVCHLAITKGTIKAKVSGSALYDVDIRIKTLGRKKWNAVKRRCAGQIGSLLELLKGDLSENIMSVVTDRKQGLFPLPGEITLACSCPDWAVMCKHVAAVLYGIGARLDERPQLLFALRGVDHEELIAADAEAAVKATVKDGSGTRLDSDNLSEIFGIDIPPGDVDKPVRKTRKKTPAKKKATTKRTAVKAKKKKTVKSSGKKRAKKAATKKKAVQSSAAKKKTAKSASRKKKAAKKTAKKAATKKGGAR